jgi:3-phenylpropionate/trans-cinnamate dioxygenase ferredoxin reductase component
VQATRVVALDPGQKQITDEHGNIYRFGTLLLATGGAPKRLSIPGGDAPGIYYYRGMDDYLRLRRETAPAKSAVVIGGGFIGSELAAALSGNKLAVTMIFPGQYLCQRVFPQGLGLALSERYRQRGIDIWSGDAPISLARDDSRFLMRTRSGRELRTDLVVVGVGIAPEIGLANLAHLQTSDGVEVNEYLQTSHPDIYAAGDNARFPYAALDRRTRVEHWDNALNQGRIAGRNMAGAREPYTYMPYFFSDLFEFGYEAVGDVNSSLKTVTDWQKENDTGIVYYLQDDCVRGVMMCNVWDKVEWARDLIRRAEKITPEQLVAAPGNA